MTFGSPNQNHMSNDSEGSKSKQEVQIQYGGRLFSETGSSSISAVDWDIWSKFGVPLALDLLKCHTRPNQKPEVDLRHYGRHVVKSIRRHNSVGDHLVSTKFGRPMQNHMPMTVKRSKFEAGSRISIWLPFFWGTGCSYISTVDWDIWSKFGMQIALSLLKCWTWPNQKPEVNLRRYGRHLVKSIWRHNYVGDRRIWTKFGRSMQNHMPTAIRHLWLTVTLVK